MLKSYSQPTLFPPGSYLVRIHRLHMGAAKSSGNLRIHYVLEIQEGPLRGQHLNKVHMLTTAAAVKQCLKEWSVAGLSMSSPAQLVEHLDAIKKAHYQVTVTQVEGKNCCYFQARMKEGHEGIGDAVPASGTKSFSFTQEIPPVTGAATVSLAKALEAVGPVGF